MSSHAKFYTPPIKQEEPLKLRRSLVAYPSKLPDIVKIRLKESAVAHQIAVGLYKSPQAGFRELYSNERRAAYIAREKFGANPKIEVTLNPEQGQLIIQGRDSLGITAQVFADVLRWMGRTTNDDGSQVGQFGWGFFALWTLANSVKLETYARETNECYGVTAHNAEAFTLLPDEEVTIEEYGTRIQIDLKKEIDLVDLAKWIERNCKYSDVETHLTITKDITSTNSWGYTSVRLEGGCRRLDGTFKEQLERRIANCCGGDRVIYDVELDAEDFYFYGVIAGDGEHAQISNWGKDILLLRVPIESPEADSLKLPFTFWVLNVKNERAYQPTPDRDRFIEGALKPIMEKLQAFLQIKLRELNIASLDDYRRATWKGIYTRLHEPLSGFLDAHTHSLATLLSTTVICPKPPEDTAVEEESNSWQYWRFRCNHRTKAYMFERLGRIASRSRNLFYYEMPRREDGKEVVPAKRMGVIKAILCTKYRDAEIFTCPSSSDAWHTDGEIPKLDNLLRKLKEAGGVPLHAKREAEHIKRELGGEWRRICGLPEAPRRKPPPVDWVIHKRSERGRVEPKRVKIGFIPADVLRVPSNLKRYIEALQLVESKYGVTKDYKALRGGIALRDFVESVKDKTVHAKRDVHLTFHEIGNTQTQIVIYFTDRFEILRLYDASSDGVLVAADGDEAFELMAYLTSKGKEYTAIRHPDDETFRKKTGFDLNEITGDYPSIGDSNRATIAYIGGCEIKMPELRTLFLHAVKETHGAGEAEWYLKSTLTLESELTRQQTSG